MAYESSGPELDWNWSGGKAGTGSYIGGHPDYGTDGKSKTQAPAVPPPTLDASAPTTGPTSPTFKFGSGSFTGDQLTGFYNNAMAAGKTEGDFAKFTAGQASQFGASADEVAAVGNFYNPKGGYNAGGVDKWVDQYTPQYDTNKAGIIAPAQYEFGAGGKKTTISGTEVQDGYLARLQAGQGNTSMGTEVLEHAVNNGGNINQIAAAMRVINPDLKPEQVAQFIAQNKLPYVVNADGTISRIGGKAPNTTVNIGGNNEFTSNSNGLGTDSKGVPTLGFNLSNIQDAKTWKVDPKTQTVAGQLEGILASDNPLMIQARTRALQQQNANGRLNSTMSASAADSAMYDAALQIATPDAAMYADNAKYNNSEQNTFGRDANGFTRDGVMADFNVRANDWAANQNQGRTLARDAIQQGYNLQNTQTAADIQTKRDATLQAYGLTNTATASEIQGRRDQILNGYTVGAAATAAEVQAARDAIANGYTVARDAKGQTYALEQIAAQPYHPPIDNSVRNRTWDLEDRTFNTAENDRKTGINLDNSTRDTLTTLRTNFTTNLVNLTGKADMDATVKRQTIDSLTLNYNDTVTAIAKGRGWSAADWLITSNSTPATTLPGNTGPVNPRGKGQEP